MIHRVLYATDGGEDAAAAGRLLQRVARRDGLEVTVLCVSDLKGVDTSVYVEDAEGPLQRNRSLVERVMQEGTRNLERAGFTVKGHVSEGLPSAEILIFLEDNPHDLVLVGAGNKTWLGRVLQGSVSLHVLHSSPTSVLIVHEAGHTSAARARVLFADDGSTHAVTARDAVAKLASPETCDLTVVSVVTRVDLAVFPNRDSLMPEQMPIDSVEMGEIENQRIGNARELAERSAGRLQDVGFRVDTKVSVGHPSQEILDLANKGDYDLVVLGSRGLGGVARTLLGSVSDSVSRHAPASLVARSSAEP